MVIVKSRSKVCSLWVSEWNCDTGPLTDWLTKGSAAKKRLSYHFVRHQTCLGHSVWKSTLMVRNAKENSICHPVWKSKLLFLKAEKKNNFWISWSWVNTFIFRCLSKECWQERVTEQPQQVSGLNRQFYKPLDHGVFSKNLPKLFLWCFCDKLWRGKTNVITDI